ncbi:MAG: AAA family ATPase [Halobacteriaceae archaeon]
MEPPLWTERYAPSVAELPQEDVRTYLGRAAEEPINLVVHGPAGVGKTAAVRALAREAHADPENDLVTINVSDFFGMTKKELSEDPRFEAFVTPKRRRNSSKAALINHVLKELAAYPPVSGTYKTVLLDNAEAIREDFQQALRRVMERHHEATQFVLTTRQPSKLIPAIRSRCFPVPMRAPTPEETVAVLERVVEAEGVAYDADGLEYVAGYADGNLRTAVLAAQATATAAGEVTMQSAYERLADVGVRDRVDEMLDDAEAGEFRDARKTLDDLLVEEGYDGTEVLEEVLAAGRSRYAGASLAELHRLAGEVDMDLATGTSDRIHLAHLLADLRTETAASD